MLLELEIRDLAIFSRARSQFDPGLSAVTGETGSGKSIFLSALELLRGGRGDAEWVRRGAERAVVSGRFALPPDSLELRIQLAELGAEDEDGELLVVREITAQGRSRVRIGGASATLRDLGRLMRHFYDIHGQHAEQRLFDASTHLSVLTRYAGAREESEAYRTAYREWQALRARIEETRRRNAELAERRDLLEFQHKELEEAGLKPGEEEELVQRLDLLGHAGQAGEWIAQVRALLAEAAPLPRSLGQLDRLIKKLAGIAPPFAEFADRLDSTRSLLDELGSRADAWEVPEEADPRELDRLNARLARLQRLRTKYKLPFDELVALRDRLARDLQALEGGAGEVELLAAEAARLEEALRERGRKLSGQRHRAAEELDAAVTRQLQSLGMSGAAFRTRFDALDLPGADGLERAVFELSPNPGEGWRELAAIASGGEASRIMLAIESVLVEADPVPLLVFDEVDAGLGGIAAGRVAELLLAIARGRQVVAITHLHQVAAAAEHHIVVVKDVHEGRTHSRVEIVEGRSREAEIARMLGDAHSATSLEHARSLLKSGGKRP